MSHAILQSIIVTLYACHFDKHDELAENGYWHKKIVFLMGVSKLRCLDICADGSPKPNFSSYYICTIFYQWCNISATHRVYSKKESLSWFWVISALHQLVCSIYHGYYALTITQKPHIKKYIIAELITRWLKLIFPPQPLVHMCLTEPYRVCFSNMK